MSMGVAERRARTRALLVALGLVTAPGCGGRAQDEQTRASAGGEVSAGGSSGMPARGGAGVGGGSGAGAAAGTASGGGGAQPSSIPGFIDVSRKEVEALYEKACAGWSWQLEPAPMTRLFLLEASDTMRGRVSDSAPQSDWDFARSAVMAAGPSLFARGATGLGFFPNRATMPQFGEALPSTACVDPRSDVAIAPDDPMNPAQWEAIVAALSAVTPIPGTGAPLFDAYRSAAAALATASAQSANVGLLALVGDGQPTLGFGCLGADDARAPLDPEPLIREIEEARNRLGVLTFVIGTPGSASTVAGTDARPWLSRAARAGGVTPFGCSDQGPKYCHYDMVSQPDLPNELTRALARPTIPPLGCTYSFGNPPPGKSFDAGRITFVYWTFDGEPKLIPRTSEDSCGVGYRFVSNGAPQLEVCPETCAAMQADRGGIQLIFGCVSSIPPSL